MNIAAIAICTITAETISIANGSFIALIDISNNPIKDKIDK